MADFTGLIPGLFDRRLFESADAWITRLQKMNLTQASEMTRRVRDWMLSAATISRGRKTQLKSEAVIPR
jgi:hypothetical protein